jgi:5'-AMP-activated protein kinase catalytic alpha subunit
MSVILERYEVEKLLGKGNFGKVFLAKDSKNGIKVAIKQMSKARLAKESHLIEYLNGEIECMRMIKSPYVMELYDVA